MEQQNDLTNINQPFDAKDKKGYLNIIITAIITVIISVGGMIIWQQMIAKNKVDDKTAVVNTNQNIPINNELISENAQNNKIIFYTKVFQDRTEDNFIDNQTEIYELNLSTKETKLIYSTKESYDNIVFNFQSANGMLTFINVKYSNAENNQVIQNKNIMLWNGKELKSIYRESESALPDYDYRLHPSGQYVMVIAKTDSKAYNLDSEDSKKYYSENKFEFYKIPLQNPSINKLYEEILTTNEYDSFVEYKIVGWTKELEPRLLLDKNIDGQLSSHIDDVFAFNPQNNNLERIISNLQSRQNPSNYIYHDIIPIDSN